MSAQTYQAVCGMIVCVSGGQYVETRDYLAEKARADAAEGRIRELTSLFRLDAPWPLIDVLRKLCEATTLLRDLHNHDSHGHELIWEALAGGEAAIVRIAAVLTPLDGKQSAGALPADRLAALLKELLDSTEEPPAANCSCHISPPCPDCTDHAHLREVLANARAELAKGGA